MNNKPIVGISTNFIKIKEAPFQDFQRIYVNSGYIDSVINAGGIPLLLPLNADRDTTNTLLDMVDGVILSGGQDVHPSFYKEENHQLLGETAIERDEQELHILRTISKAGKPILGICRGLQLINVAFGGTLYQDLSLYNPKSKDLHGINHHSVSLTTESALHKIFPSPTISTNSYHHQAIKELAKGFTVSARSSDGVIEGIESHNPWIMAVQWHPETMLEMKKLFQALILQASCRRSRQ